MTTNPIATVDARTSQSAAPLCVLVLDHDTAAMIRDGLDVLDPDDEDADAHASDLYDALQRVLMPELMRGTESALLITPGCDVCAAPGVNPCDACLPGCIATPGAATRLEGAARAFLDAFGGNVPDWLQGEAAELVAALDEIEARAEVDQLAAPAGPVTIAADDLAALRKAVGFGDSFVTDWTLHEGEGEAEGEAAVAAIERAEAVLEALEAGAVVLATSAAQDLGALLLAIAIKRDAWAERQAPEGQDMNDDRDQEEADTVVAVLDELLAETGLERAERAPALDA